MYIFQGCAYLNVSHLKLLKEFHNFLHIILEYNLGKILDHSLTVVIVNRSLTMITSCNKEVNFNYVATGVALALNEQLLCNWHMALMHTIMPRVRSNEGP
jgi:hypothetical protein